MSIPLPSQVLVTPIKDKPFGARIEISPLYPGYGQTVGNALRRVLLSSLEGAGVTSVKIKGADHEFTTLPHIKEEVLEIILNLKQLNLKLFTDEPESITLSIKGKKDVTANDFKKNANVEIANSELKIATLTHKDAELSIDAVVEKGIGFNTVEERQSELELGAISIDTVFSPVTAVGYTVEDIRVGKQTDYDKLVITIETNGTISPQDAIYQALQILVHQLNFVLEKSSELVQKHVVKEEKKISKEVAPKAKKQTVKKKKTDS
jgi:DNA-directed RNA polymerase subunit alpha